MTSPADISPYKKECGSASVLGVSLVAALLVITTLLAPLCAALSARQNMAGAADAAALAAANTASGRLPGVPCEAAERTAAVNGARLDACDTDGLEVTVTVSTSVLVFTVSAMARAGPPPH